MEPPGRWQDPGIGLVHGVSVVILGVVSRASVRGGQKGIVRSRRREAHAAGAESALPPRASSLLRTSGCSTLTPVSDRTRKALR